MFEFRHLRGFGRFGGAAINAALGDRGRGARLGGTGFGVGAAHLEERKLEKGGMKN